LGIADVHDEVRPQDRAGLLDRLGFEGRCVICPAFGLLSSSMIAAQAMSFSSASVVANAQRLRTAAADN
jgi:cation transport ATPase